MYVPGVCLEELDVGSALPPLSPAWDAVRYTLVTTTLILLPFKPDGNPSLEATGKGRNGIR